MTRTISNADDIIDSRDIIARIEELEEKRETLSDRLEECKAAHEAALDGAPDMDTDAASGLDDATDELAGWDEENGEELAALKALAEECEGIDDWTHGVALINEHYFTEYCMDLVSDIGDLPKNIPHYLVIDWEKTADNLRMDYTSVDFAGQMYLVR